MFAEKKLWSYFMSRELFLQITRKPAKITKIRTHKNLVPHGILVNLPCYTRKYQQRQIFIIIIICWINLTLQKFDVVIKRNRLLLAETLNIFWSQNVVLQNWKIVFGKHCFKCGTSLSITSSPMLRPKFSPS